ncbi:MAG: hypothetical protein Q9M26_00580 [Mariprofundales bacterium]|nr:hypothetical protein [Mariprofundales bacterium]
MVSRNKKGAHLTTNANWRTDTLIYADGSSQGVSMPPPIISMRNRVTAQIASGFYDGKAKKRRLRL